MVIRVCGLTLWRDLSLYLEIRPPCHRTIRSKELKVLLYCIVYGIVLPASSGEDAVMDYLTWLAPASWWALIGFSPAGAVTGWASCVHGLLGIALSIDASNTPGMLKSGDSIGLRPFRKRRFGVGDLVSTSTWRPLFRHAGLRAASLCPWWLHQTVGCGCRTSLSLLRWLISVEAYSSRPDEEEAESESENRAKRRFLGKWETGRYKEGGGK